MAFEGIAELVVKGRAAQLKNDVASALAEGAGAGEILDALIEGMGVVGERFKENKVFLPEVMMAAKAMNEGMSLIEPMLAGGELNRLGKVIIGTVKGDQHDIGKNLVAMMLTGAGFDVIDLGVNVDPSAFVNGARESGARLIGLSALLTTTMPMMKETIAAFEEAGMRGEVKIMVGGAPVDEAFATEIGADGYSEDAVSAVELAKRLAI